MTTKYIVNNVTDQTIDGNITINGNVIITGSSISNSIGTYKALFTQTGSLTGTSIMDFNFGLVIGETYTITNYIDSADFSNIANVQSGTINQTGCVFIATGQTPNSWVDNTQLISGGDLVVDVLENTLGYDLSWVYGPFGPGTYVAFNNDTGPYINSFPRNSVSILTNINPFNNYASGTLLQVVGGFGTVSNIDDTIFVGVWSWDSNFPLDNALYYTPIEIKIKQDLNTTPIETYGFNVNNLPYGNVSVRIYAGESLVSTFYNNSYTVVNNITEMVAKLNSDTGTNHLGTYSVNNGVENGIILTMKTNLKNQFSPNNTLTFEVFND